ncbi:MAG TPA: hypothetical protein V6C85_20235 [Allocoleopsis sp.]
MLLLKEILKFLGNVFQQNARRGDRVSSNPELSEQSRLIRRLQSLQLKEDELNYLQAHLTLLLQARHQPTMPDSLAAHRSDCIVLEMDREEHQQFTQVVGGNGIRLFRVLVQSDDSQLASRKLAIVSQNGLRVFKALVQSVV